MYVDIPQTRELFTHYLARDQLYGPGIRQCPSILDKEKMTDKSVVVYLSEQGNNLPLPNGLVMMRGYTLPVYRSLVRVVKPGSVK